MGKVTWKRKSVVKAERTPPPAVTPLIPAIKQRSTKDFRPPPTIEDDFRRYLMHEVPHVNYTFEQIHDWYDTLQEDYKPLYIRAQQTPIDWKSKIGNSDMSTNFKTTHDVPIYRGDIVRREDGTIFMLNWNITNHPNNQATQCLECNAYLTFVRPAQRELSEDGFYKSDEHNPTKVIVDKMPCSHTEYAGRPDFSGSEGQAGIVGQHLISVSLQWNEQTKEIRIGDCFTIDRYTYRVINVSFAEVHISGARGVLTVNAKRVEGGVLDD